MAKSSFKYTRRERTVEDIRRKASEGSRDYDNLFKGDVKLFKPNEGENIIRIMPATWGFQPFTDAELDKMSEAELKRLSDEEEKYGNGWDLPIYVHYGVGPDNASYLCRDKMRGERCSICEAKAKTRNPDEADALAPTKRGLVWIIDRNAEKDGPILWSMPFSKIRNEIYSRSVDKKHGTPIIVDDVDEGFDIIFNRAGKDDRTNYTGVEVDRDPTPLHDDEKKQGKWLDYIMEHPLQEILNFYDEEHIEKVLFGQKSARRGQAQDEEETPSGKRDASRGSLRRGRLVEAEERDYVNEEGAEEEEAPATASRGRSGARAAAARSKAPVSEEPDEEIEEEEGGKEAPPLRGRPSASRRVGRQVAKPEEEEEEVGAAEASPSEQARGRLRSLRSRR